MPRQKQTAATTFVVDDLDEIDDNEDYVGSEEDSDHDEGADTQYESSDDAIETDIDIITPPRRYTRAEPPVTPTPKKTPGRVVKPPVTPTPKTPGGVIKPPVTPTPNKTPGRGVKRVGKGGTGDETPSPRVESPKKQRSGHTSTALEDSPSKKPSVQKKEPRKLSSAVGSISGASVAAGTKAFPSENTDQSPLEYVDDQSNAVNVAVDEDGVLDDNASQGTAMGDNDAALVVEDDESDNNQSLSEDEADDGSASEGDDVHADVKGRRVDRTVDDGKIRVEEDLDPKVKMPALTRCGVFDKDLVDKYLKATYRKLPMLPSGKRLVGWTSSSQASLDGFAFFANIKDTFPKADMKYLRSLICFDADWNRNLVNLSRVDPTLLCIKTVTQIYPNSSYLCFRGGSVPARCLMMGMVHEDRTRSAYQLSNGKWMKSLSIIPFALETERMIATTALVLGVEQFRGQLIGNVLSFATRQADLTGEASSPMKSTKGKRFAKPSASTGKPSNSTLISLRSPEELIPVLDARDRRFELPDDFKKVVDTFPRFSATIPQDSVVLVCYTTSKYEKKEEVNVSFNLLWAVVLCGDDA